MTSFDRAWMLAKMPLVRDSIREHEPTEHQLNNPWMFPLPRYTAVFQDRDDPDKQYPMEARMDQNYNITMKDPDNNRRTTYASFRPYDERWSNVKTTEGYGRKGMMTAAYDLMNEILRRRGKRLTTHPGNLNDYSGPFWAKHLGLPWEGETREWSDIHTRQTHSETIDAHTKWNRDNRELLYWPEEGVYE
jgi:hypothetical protein